MQYMLINYVNEGGWTAATKAQQEEGVAAYLAFTNALTAAGVFVSRVRLQQSASANTVRLEKGKARVLAGPYADLKEQFGGFFIIDVPDLDAAMSWAVRCPATGHGVVEVRALGVLS